MKNLLFLIILTFPITTWSQTNPPSVLGQLSVELGVHTLPDERPPLSVKTVALQSVLSPIGGAVAGFALGYPLGLFTNRDDSENDLQFLPGFFVGLAIGYTVGTAATVYWLGKTRTTMGSFTSALIGSALGLGIGAVIMFGILDFPEDGVIPTAILMPILSILWFNRSRTHRTIQTALFNQNGGLGFPRIQVMRHGALKHQTIPMISLLQINR